MTRSTQLLTLNAMSDEIDVGGGGPLHRAKTTLMRREPDDDKGSGSLTLSQNEGAAARGAELEERIRQAIARDDDKGIRALGRLVEECDELAARSPLLQDYVAFLARAGRDAAVKRITGGRRRGRRYVNHGLLVGAMLWVLEREGCAQLAAAEHVRDLYPDQLRHKTARSIVNDFRRHREQYELQREGYFVPAARLTTRRWLERRTR